MSASAAVHFAEGPNPEALCSAAGPVASMTGNVTCAACLTIWELRRELYEARGELVGLRLAVDKARRHSAWLRAKLDLHEARSGEDTSRPEAGCTRVDATGNEVETTRVVAMGARSRVEFEGAVVLAVVRIGGNP